MTFLLKCLDNLSKMNIIKVSLLKYYLVSLTKTMKTQSKMMKAVILEAPKVLRVKEIPIPKPGPGQVLVKVMAAPINPSDLAFMEVGQYSNTKKTPCTAGFQGSGLVVENGGGLFGWSIMNKKVAFSPIQSSGTYAQYSIAKADQCIPVQQQMSFQQASMSLVNPMTAIGFLDIIKTANVKTIIHTAAASSLGRMLNRYFAGQKINIINIVRRKQQVQLLQSQGVKYIVNSSQQNYEANLSKMIVQLKATILFDAIGNQTTGKILKLMPKGSTAYIYGVLSHQIMFKNIDSVDILYNDKSVKGFFLPNWLKQKGTVKLLPTIYKLRKLLKKQLSSSIAKQVGMEQFQDGLKYYLQNMTKGKVVLKPWMECQRKQEKKQEKNQKLNNTSQNLVKQQQVNENQQQNHQILQAESQKLKQQNVVQSHRIQGSQK